MSEQNTGAPETIIKVRDVCFSYGDQEVLHNVSFDVREYELVAIVGPNGGGKTTLLKMMLGELVPRYGTIRIFDTPPTSARQRISYVPQIIPFDPRFPVSVAEVILMGRAARARLGIMGRKDRQIAERSLERVALAGFAKRSFSEISGGERQRVMIAQALASEPDLLLFDEPVANVDPQHATQLYNLFKELTREGVTVLMVSHNLGVVTAHATSLLCINRTAGMHTIEDVELQTFTEAFGGTLTAIKHDTSCHVLDPSLAVSQPHRGHPQ